MYLRSIFSLVAFLLFHASLFSQTTIVKGTVIDKETDESLPFATVIFTGTTIGTTTDIDGKFVLSTTDLELKFVTVSYVGYESREFRVGPGKLNEETVKLKELRLELDVVEVRAKRRTPKDTAAIALFRNVVKNKYRNDPRRYDDYQYHLYTKTEFGIYDVSDKFKESKMVKRYEFMLDNMDTLSDGTEVLPVLLKETSKEVYHRKSPHRHKEIMLGDRFSGIDNASFSDIIDYSFEPLEVYNNLFNINAKPIMSPFADNARFSYKYFLTDTAVFDGLTCYKLEFTGRGNDQAAFTGHAWIHDSTYAIQYIKLTVLAGTNINFISDFVVEQRFRLVDNQYWFKDYEFMQTQYNFFNNDKGVRQSFLVRRTDEREEIKVNSDIPDSVFSGSAEIVMEGAREQDETFWDTARISGLNEREQNIFNTVDSIKSTAFYRNVRWFVYMLTTGYMDAGYIEFGKFHQFYSWNGVEGNRVRLGIRTRPDLSEKIQFIPHVAYGFDDDIWKYGLAVKMHLKRNNERWHMVGAEHIYDYDRMHTDNLMLRTTPRPYDNLALSILRKDPLTDIYLMRKSVLWYEKEWGYGINMRLTFRHRTFYSVPTGKKFVPSDATGPAQDSSRDFTVAGPTFSFVWARGMQFFDSKAGFRRFPLASVNPIVYLDYEPGIKGLLNGDFTYHWARLGLRQRFLNPIGYTYYTLEAGGVFGSAPYPLLYTHPGNETFVYDQWTYQLVMDGEFISDRYASLWVTHHFDGFILDKIPLISKLQLRSVAAVKVLYGTLEPSNESIYEMPEGTTGLNELYLEAGVGVENILKLFRVDFYFRVTQRDKADINKWGVKIYLAPRI